MYKKILCALLVISFAAAMGGCGNSNSDTSSSEIKRGVYSRSSDEEESSDDEFESLFPDESEVESEIESEIESESESKDESAVSKSAFSDELSDEWDSFEFTLNGKLFSLMFDYKDLEAEGWSFDPADYGYDEDYTLEKYDWEIDIDLENDDYDTVVNIGLQNIKSSECALKDAQVWDVIFDATEATGELPDVVLPGGITWGSTVEEIEAAYGKPTTKDEYSDGFVYQYKDEEGDVLYLEIYNDYGLLTFDYTIY